MANGVLRREAMEPDEGEDVPQAGGGAVGGFLPVELSSEPMRCVCVGAIIVPCVQPLSALSRSVLAMLHMKLIRIANMNIRVPNAQICASERDHLCVF